MGINNAALLAPDASENHGPGKLCHMNAIAQPRELSGTGILSQEPVEGGNARRNPCGQKQEWL